MICRITSHFKKYNVLVQDVQEQTAYRHTVHMSQKTLPGIRLTASLSIVALDQHLRIHF